ncbi:FecCD family ABC transporter permease [Brevibacillus massiliensis]|jgi:iron complex transport system permease protein|uniref:FecCD family ABC transporter permease n=1 Tax=Brevibacillus massiliensis TaxID=1118054 RepID=UPI00030CB573|nr:iron ABC transporter permease [Brevibacillus massiliensis]
MKRKLLLYGGGALVLLLLSASISLSVGTANVPLVQVWKILLHQLPLADHWIQPTWTKAEEMIITQVRLSRVVLAMLVGASLALAGSGFQGVLRNPLADPYTLGVASGASVGAAFLILFGLQAVLGQWTVSIAAFVTGSVTLFIVFSLASSQGKMRVETLILSGVVLQAFLGSLVSFMVSLSNNVVNEILFWLMGSLSMRNWDFSLLLLPYLTIGAIVLAAYSRTLNLFALGERQAAHLGVNVERSKTVVLIVSTLLTAGAVSVSGVIGFVGLVVPHLVRLMFGPDYRLLVPMSAILGGGYVLWADTLARTLLSPKEIPLGVVTAMIGAPFFAYLLVKQKARMKG